MMMKIIEPITRIKGNQEEDEGNLGGRRTCSSSRMKMKETQEENEQPTKCYDF